MQHHLMDTLRRVASGGRKQPVNAWLQPFNSAFIPWGSPQTVWCDGS